MQTITDSLNPENRIDQTQKGETCRSVQLGSSS